MNALRASLRAEIALRARLAHLLPFGDTGQAIMLDLALASIEGRSVCVTSACIAAYGRERTTGLPYIARLVEAGLVRREPDPSDGRRVWVHITADGFALVAEAFEPVAVARAA